MKEEEQKREDGSIASYLVHASLSSVYHCIKVAACARDRVDPLGAEEDFTALWCERSHHHSVDIPTLDVGNITAALPGGGGAGVVVPAAHQLCDIAVAAASTAPVHPQRAVGHPIEPDA